MKTLTIIKAIGAGVTALYLAYESSERTVEGHTVGNVDCAVLSRTARQEFAAAIRSLIAPEQQEEF